MPSGGNLKAPSETDEIPAALRGQIVNGYQIALTEKYGSLDGRLQLANISRPTVSHHQLACFWS